jgi:hypothetical protein
MSLRRTNVYADAEDLARIKEEEVTRAVARGAADQ